MRVFVRAKYAYELQVLRIIVENMVMVFLVLGECKDNCCNCLGSIEMFLFFFFLGGLEKNTNECIFSISELIRDG